MTKRCKLLLFLLLAMVGVLVVHVIGLRADWHGNDMCEALPFSVQFLSVKAPDPGINRRIVFRSGKMVGLDKCVREGHAGFAVYALADRTFYLVDGWDDPGWRCEYRVNVQAERVERKCGMSWVRIPDGALGVESWSESALVAKTDSGYRQSDDCEVVERPQGAQRYLGCVTSWGKFLPQRPEPKIVRDETTWRSSKVTDEIPFAYEAGEAKSGRRFSRIAFKSGKRIVTYPSYDKEGFDVYRRFDGCFLLVPKKASLAPCVYRIDTENETVDMIISERAVRIPDSALCIKGYGTSGSNVHVDVVDSIVGPVTLSSGSHVENPIEGAKLVCAGWTAAKN